MTNDSRTTTFPTFDGAKDGKVDDLPVQPGNTSSNEDEQVLDDEEFRHQEEEVAAESLGKRFLEPKTLASFLFAAIVLFFVVRQAKIDPREAWSYIRETNIAYFGVALATFYLSFVVRAVRWRGMLDRANVDAEHGYPVPGLPGILKIMLLSWFANCVVPAKLGDAFRGYLFKERTGASFGKTMGTVLAERLVDLVVLVGLLTVSGLVVFGTHIPSKAEKYFLLGAGTVLVGVAGVIVLWFARDHIERFLPDRFSSHFQKLSTGIFHSLRRPLPVIGWTIVIWVMDGIRLWFVAKSLGFELHVAESQLVSLSSALVTIIPFTPGGLGFVEAFMVWMLGQVDIVKSPASAVVFLDRLITWFSLIVVGVPLYLFYLRHKVVRAGN